MFARYGCLSVLPWILFSQMSWDLTAVPVIAAPTSAPTSMYEVPPEINDPDGVFSNGAKREARQALRRLRSSHRVLILIETVDSLDAETLENAARRRARPLGASGVYVLVLVAGTGQGSDRDVAVTLGRNQANGLLSEPDRATIRDAFLGPLRAGDADRGLEQGLRAIDATLAEAAASRPKPSSQHLVLPLTILATLLIVLMAIQSKEGEKGRRRRGRRPSLLARNEAAA